MAKQADLSPPLGFPGGTCHVVKRIDDENPRNEDKLIELVERGKSLSNSDAAKVYSIEREKGVWKFENLMLTAHAQYRMDLRGITVPEVRLALANFFRHYNKMRSQRSKPQAEAYVRDIEESFMRGSEIVWDDSKVGNLRVVFSANVSKKQIRLITAFWRGVKDPAPSICRIARRWLEEKATE